MRKLLLRLLLPAAIGYIVRKVRTDPNAATAGAGQPRR
jgi:hypothetical protein